MPRRIRLLTVLALLVAGIGTWGALQVFASSATKASPSVTLPAGKISKLQPIGEIAFHSTQLIHTYLQDADIEPFAYTAVNFTPVDGVTTVNCNPPRQYKGSCAIEIDQNIQALGTAADQDSAICTAVDGNFLNCPFLGTLSPTHYTNSAAIRAVNLPAGFHTVQDYFYSDGNALLGYISFAYRLYGTG
jgi:hypothetical protein